MLMTQIKINFWEYPCSGDQKSIAKQWQNIAKHILAAHQIQIFDGVLHI